MTAAKKTVCLEKVKIDFGPENGDKLYMKHLFSLTNRQFARMLGYKANQRSGSFSLLKNKKNGNYNAFRFKALCTKLGLDPSEILSEYEHKLSLCYSGTELTLEESKELYRLMCEVP